MPWFQYNIENEAGLPETGTLVADDLESARRQLARRGVVLHQMKPLDDASVTVPAGTDGESPMGALARPSATLGFLTQLRALSEEIDSRRIRRALREFADRLESGEPLPEAYAVVRSGLGTSLVTLLDVGIARERAELLLVSYADHCRRLADVRRGLWTALAYPVLMLSLITALAIGISISVVPTFRKMFSDFGTELPGLTRYIFDTARTVEVSWPMLLAGLVVIPALAWLILRLIGGRALPQDLFRTLPNIGTVYRWASLASFCESLSLLISLELPLPNALRLAGQMTDDLTLADGARDAARLLEAGGTPEEVSASFRQMMPELMTSLRRSRNDESLVAALRSAREIYAARSRLELNLATWWIEPVLITFTAFLIGLIITALFMPLVRLLNDLS